MFGKKAGKWLLSFVPDSDLVDAVYAVLIGYKLIFLLALSMDANYLMGFKKKLLQVLARSQTVRLWLKVWGPLLSFSAILVAVINVNRASRGDKKMFLSTRTMAKFRLLASIDVVFLYCISRLYELIRGDARPALELEESA